MKCLNCKKEILNDSKFCPFCGAEIKNKIVKKEEIKKVVKKEVKEDIKKEEVKKEQPKVEEKKKKEPKEIRIPSKTKKLYTSIFVIVLSIIAFIIPFSSITTFSSIFDENNLINFFLNVNLSKLSASFVKSEATLYLGLGVIGYILIIGMMALCLVNLVLCIMYLILNKESKLINIFVSINFGLSLILNLIGFDGGFTEFIIAFTILYVIGLLIFKVIESKEQTALKVVKGIGTGFFIISFVVFYSCMSIGENAYTGIFGYIHNLFNIAYVTDYGVAINTTYVFQFVFYLLLTIAIIGSIVILMFYNRKFIVSVIGFAIFFLGIIFTITLNIPSTYLIQTFITPSVLYVLSSVLLIVVDLISFKRSEKLEEK